MLQYKLVVNVLLDHFIVIVDTDLQQLERALVVLNENYDFFSDVLHNCV